MGVALRAFDTADTEEVVALWKRCGLTRPWNDPRADIARKLTVQPELFRLAVERAPVPEAGAPRGDVAAPEAIVGSVMAGYDGHRGWMYYLAVHPARRGAGIARALVADAEARLLALGCPKAMLMVRRDNGDALGLYDALGYRTDEVHVRGRRLIADHAPASEPRDAPAAAPRRLGR
ncbi:GNAT family acetyltransferase [Leucobacter allii]|uniref:GNAT family acetyltransferase n=1 Tax=Leucobacter allii TaxID=2932247 RepID=A0ABY4FPR3_9MICO|nr:GNAT family acetyltransferase [Leucobacter allii]UOQ58236.1 GNAT family acetyltransferase [Leucobacter allii]